jgi:ribonuclease HI
MTLHPTKTTIWQLNMHRSIDAMDELVDRAQNQKILPIILITEPYCVDGKAIFDSVLYKTYSQVSLVDRPRAAIAVPNSTNAYAFDYLSNRDTTTIKLEDSLTKKSMFLVSAYLADKKDKTAPVVGQLIQDIVNLADTQKWGLLIGSDSNAHSLLWGSKDQNPRGTQVESFMATNNLSIINTGNTPTWKTSWGDSVIDITITNKTLEDRVSDWLVNTEYHSFSDHRLITYDITYTSNEKTITCRNYSKANWDIFRESLIRQTKSYAPNPKWGSKRLDQAAAELDRTINKALNKACPEYQITIGKNTPKSPDWYQPETKKLSAIVGKCHKAYIKDRSVENRTRYQEAKKSLKINIKTNKKICSQNLCANLKDIKSFAKLTKNLMGSKPTPIGMLKDPASGLTTTTVDEVAAALLDKHLPGSTPTKNQEKIIPPIKVDLAHKDLEFINTTRLTEAIGIFGPQKTAGPDKLKPIVLQNLPPCTRQNLCILYKVSIAIGHVPKRWLQSKVIFLPKVGKPDYSDPNAYRPISLCSFILKGLERLVLFHLEETCLIKKPLSKAQHAFRKNMGTETALSEAVDKIESGLLRKEHTLGVFLDIAGAFNNLSFESAISSMRKRKFPTKIVDWYKYFLYNQESTYELNGNFYTRTLTKGCPQGGVLSPLVWNINFDPILEELNGGPVKVIGFADDACLLITGIDPTWMVDRIQPYINKMVEWGAKSGLKFNESKTVAVMYTLHRTARHKYKQIMVNNQKIDYSTEAKYLGVTLDSKLSFKKHLTSKFAKAKRLMFAIKSCISKQIGPNLSLTRLAFKMLVKPVLNYGCHVFANKLTDSLRSDLQHINRLAALSLGSVPHSSPTISLEVLYNLRPLDLEMELTAMKTHSRITQNQDPNRALPWDSKGKNKTDGHLKYWSKRLDQYGISNPSNRDKIPKTKVWTNNFTVPDFETTKNEARDKYDHFVCYTDGSRKNNKTGYGFVIKKFKRIIYEDKGNLGPSATVFQAELKAITMACITLKQRKNMDITIRSDSQAAISAVRAINISSKTVLECKTWLNKLGSRNRVTLAWLKAHAGHPGNDRADWLAKEGTTQGGSGPWPNEPASHLQNKLQEKTNDKWQQNWDANPDVCKHSKAFIQNISQNATKLNKTLVNNSDRQLVGILVQFITGHCGLRYHAKKTIPATDPKCRFCLEDAASETPIHLIGECEALTVYRQQLFNQDTLRVNFDWTFNQILDFLRETGIWNKMVWQV